MTFSEMKPDPNEIICNNDHLNKTYEKAGAEQKINLKWGTRLRTLRMLEGQAEYAKNKLGLFTQDDVDLINTICLEAQERARKDMQHEKALLPPREVKR